LPEKHIPGIEVEEDTIDEHSIANAPASITVFMGRTLRGPVNEPTTVRSFPGFEKIFGGLWTSSTLSFAVEQFFAHGGQHAIVIRVINGGERATLDLPSAERVLTLRAVNPGSGECLRASVDYDHIGENESDRFNLVLQSLAHRGSPVVLDQEIHRRVSVDPGSGRFVAGVLADSKLMRVQGAVPGARPDCVRLYGAGDDVRYRALDENGDDGDELSDYDVIGSAEEATGLFALRKVGLFNFLYIPPLAPGKDVRPVSLLVAARYCKERNAMLLVDAPARWESAAAGWAQFRKLSLRSTNAALFFPRLLARDRISGEVREFPPCAAVAGAIARADETGVIWHGESALTLRHRVRPSQYLSSQVASRMGEEGLNCLKKVGGATRLDRRVRTLAGQDSAVSAWKDFGARRLALFILHSLALGTRWVTFERNVPDLRDKVCTQVGGFLSRLYRDGMLCGDSPGQAYFVHCDVDKLAHPFSPGLRVTILVGLALLEGGDFQIFSITLKDGGTRIRPHEDLPYTAVAV